MDRLPHFPPDASSGFGGPAPPGSHELRASTRIGTEVAGFRIESVLGRGGMSVVYVAEQIRLARKVALKVLTNELAWDEQFRERFVRESHIAATIDHPNIIPIYDAGRGRRAPLHRHALRSGARSEGDPQARHARRRPDDLPDRAARQRARRRARTRARPSRREAGQHPRRGEHRPRLPHGLRRREADDCARPDFHRPLSRHRRVRGSRADRGRTGRRAHRRLCPRLRPLRVPDRVAALFARDGTRRPARAPRRSAAVREPCSARSASGVRQRGCDRDGEGGGRPVRLVRRARPRRSQRGERNGAAGRRQPAGSRRRRSPRLRLPPRPRGRSRSPRPFRPSYRPSPLRRLESRPARD